MSSWVSITERNCNEPQLAIHRHEASQSESLSLAQVNSLQLITQGDANFPYHGYISYEVMRKISYGCPKTMCEDMDITQFKLLT